MVEIEAFTQARTDPRGVPPWGTPADAGPHQPWSGAEPDAAAHPLPPHWVLSVTMPDPRSDLWTRLALLDRCCEVALTRTQGPGGPGWQVRVARRDADLVPPITVQGARLVEVLEDVLRRVQALRWME